MKLFFILLLLINSSFSLLCIDSIFDSIFAYTPRSFKVQPKKEICYKYKLSKNKNKISLTFTLAKSYTAEVVIYKSQYEIEMKNSNYINYIEKYLIVDHIFKEIDVKDFYDYIYIIIRDKKYYFFNDNIVLYDSEVPILLENNKPIEIENFMSNNKYIFYYYSKKNLQFVYSTNIKSQKYVTVEYDGIDNFKKKLDNKDIIINLKNEENSQKLLKIIIENIENGENQEFSVIVYEKEPDDFLNIAEDEIIKTNYIKNDNQQNFYFFGDISNYSKSSSITFKLDYMAKIKNYIYIIADIIYSDKIISQEKFKDLIPSKNKLKYSYIPLSDEYFNLYFEANKENQKYKYLIIKVEIKDYSAYYSPKYFTLSLSKELETINLINIDYYKTQIISKTTRSYIPFYFKLELNKNSKYIFTTPYQDYILLRNGDLLKNSKVNKNFIDDEKDIIIFSDLKEVTIQIFGNELKNAVFYVEKIDSTDVIIIENERINAEISINMDINQKKYILGTYNKDLYTDGAKIETKYWMAREGEFNLYYKNTISIEGQSLFPTLDKNKKLEETPFILNNNIDLLTITCSKTGTLYLKPIMKNFSEKTHIISQNSISTISMDSKTEILQLSSPIKSPSQFLYLSILPLNGNNITISPDTKDIFDEITIKQNELFTTKIDINKYKSDQLAIKISFEDFVDLEVIEVIHYNFSEYVEISNNEENKITKNNIVKFINKKTKKLKINVNELSNVTICYGIVKLATNDINYIPLAYNFGNLIKKNCSSNEYFEFDNKYYGEKEDIYKKYQAFIFSIQSSKIYYKYNIQIEEISDKIKIRGWIIGLIIILSIIILFIIFIVIIIIKKKKGLNVENIKVTQPLYPNKKYILNDIVSDN